MSDPISAPPSVEERRVHAVVALRVLETMRDMDLPLELLEDEDPTQTIPRRFGLSDVVSQRIRSYGEQVRKRARITDDEIQGLFRLVIRRPDSADVFRRVGRLLVEGKPPSPLVRILPRAIQFAIARSRAGKRLKRLFGRRVGGFRSGPFIIEGRSLIFIETDPGGDACELLSGFSEEVLEQTLGGRVRVTHSQCQSRRDERCRWEGEIVESRATVSRREPDRVDEYPVTDDDPNINAGSRA